MSGPLEIRQAVAKIVKFSGEPKSADIRRLSQKAISKLFSLSPATFTLILRTLPKADQDNANKILSTYVSELPSSGDESDRETSASSASRIKKATPTKVCDMLLSVGVFTGYETLYLDGILSEFNENVLILFH